MAATAIAIARVRPVVNPTAVAPATVAQRRSMQATNLPAISDLLKPGQEILVQIAKEPIAKKGARITSHIALPAASWSSCRPSATPESRERSSLTANAVA